MRWRIVDIASHQRGINIEALDCDGIIIKATQGSSYVNPYYSDWTQRALARGLMVGASHYATGAGVAAEVEHFLRVVEPYIGKVLLVLDWETNPGVSGQNAAFGHNEYADSFLQLLRHRTGATPLIYMSKSVTRGDWGATAAEFPLWGAQYASMSRRGWEPNPWTDSSPWGPWESPLLHQYTSRGRIAGYEGDLDLSLADCTTQNWMSLAGEVRKPDISKLPLLKMGSRNKTVKVLQERLNAFGAGLQTDGIFGRLTKAAVMEFQRERGLLVDGIVGPQTWGALYN